MIKYLGIGKETYKKVRHDFEVSGKEEKIDEVELIKNLRVVFR